MRHNSFTKRILCTATICAFLLCGCQSNVEVTCPFTDHGWNTTEETLFEAEGDYKGSYESTYGGTTYIYPGTYMDKEGTLKYMYDDEGVLMSVAWAFSSNDIDELDALYNKILTETESNYGKSEYTTQEATNYGAMWELKNGHIVLSVMQTENNKALQISYINPLDQEN